MGKNFASNEVNAIRSSTNYGKNTRLNIFFMKHVSR